MLKYNYCLYAYVRKLFVAYKKTISLFYRYFTRPSFVGLSVFRNERTLDQSLDRGAHMAAVGILVTPTTETGLCGRPWNHLLFLQNEILYVF